MAIFRTCLSRWAIAACIALGAVTVSGPPAQAAQCSSLAHTGWGYADNTPGVSELELSFIPWAEAPFRWSGPSSCPYSRLDLNLRIDHANGTSSGEILLSGSDFAATYSLTAYGSKRSLRNELSGRLTDLTVIGLTEPQQTTGPTFALLPGGAQLFLGGGAVFGQDYIYPKDYPEQWNQRFDRVDWGFAGDPVQANTQTDPLWAVYFYGLGLVPVPLPPGIAMLGASLAVLGGARALRQRKTTTRLSDATGTARADLTPARIE